MNDFIIHGVTKDSVSIKVLSVTHWDWWVTFDLIANRSYDSGLKGAKPTDLWLEQAKIAALAKLEQVKKQKQEIVFVRFGEIPENGISYNYRDNRHEPGVSVYPAIKVGKQIRIDMTGMDMSTYLFVQVRTAYFVKGEVVGYGSDGEPCLKIEKKRKINREIYELTIN